MPDDSPASSQPTDTPPSTRPIPINVIVFLIVVLGGACITIGLLVAYRRIDRGNGGGGVRTPTPTATATARATADTNGTSDDDTDNGINRTGNRYVSSLGDDRVAGGTDGASGVGGGDCRGHGLDKGGLKRTMPVRTIVLVMDRGDGAVQKVCMVRAWEGGNTMVTVRTGWVTGRGGEVEGEDDRELGVECGTVARMEWER